MATKTLPDATWLRECLDYNPDTGAFTWRERPQRHFARSYEYKRWNVRYAGKRAENGDRSRHDYLRISFGGKAFKAHRLAWLLIHGEPVPDLIDHIDGAPHNNGIDNLRAVSNSENKMNARRRVDNVSGVKGVLLLKIRPRYIAYITVGGRVHHLGTFMTLEDAASARREAAERLHGEFVHHG